MTCRRCNTPEAAPLGRLCHDCIPQPDDAFPLWVLVFPMLVFAAMFLAAIVTPT